MKSYADGIKSLFKSNIHMHNFKSCMNLLDDSISFISEEDENIILPFTNLKVSSIGDDFVSYHHIQ